MRSPRWTKFASVTALIVGFFALAGTSDEASAADRAKDAEKYTQDLKTSSDPKVKVTALNELGKLGQVMKAYATPAVPDMIAALKDKDAAVRAAAAKNLGMVDPDPKEAVPALVAVVNDKKEKEEVRIAAIQGLAAMGPSAKPANKDLNELAKVEGKDSKLTRAVMNARRAINPKN